MKRHYIYRMVNDTTGEFYIGKRSCKGEPAADNKYMGSGKIIKNKVKKHPEQWRKEILCFASSPEQLNQAEKWAIGTQWLDDPLCLNCTPGGDGRSAWTEEDRAAQSERSKKYFESEEARAAQSARTKKYFASEEARAAQAARTKAHFESEEARTAQSARTKKRWESEAARAAHSAKMKKYWESEEVRAAQSARQKKVKGTEEARAAMSAQNKKYWTEEARAAQAVRTKEVQGTEEARAANAARAREQFKVRLASPVGDRVEIARSLVLDYLLSGYTFTQRAVWVHNDELKQRCFYNSKRAVALLLSNTGWSYGCNKAYTPVGIKQVDNYPTED